jgi:hypothetical protein
MSNSVSCAVCGVLIFLCGASSLKAQHNLNTDIPIVMAGVLHALEYTESVEGGSGATVDGSLSWTSSDGPGLHLTFSDYR